MLFYDLAKAILDKDKIPHCLGEYLCAVNLEHDKNYCLRPRKDEKVVIANNAYIVKDVITNIATNKIIVVVDKT